MPPTYNAIHTTSLNDWKTFLSTAYQNEAARSLDITSHCIEAEGKGKKYREFELTMQFPDS
jgi:hypothetical protein